MKKQVDVLFWANIAPNKRGSFEDFIFCLSKEASIQGINIIFVFLSNVNDHLKNIHCIETDTEKIHSLLFLKTLLKKIQPDIIHFHFMGLANNMVWRCKSSGIKNIVFTDHESSRSEHKPGLAAFVKKYRRSLYIKKIDAVTAVSDFVVQRFQKNNLIARDKVTRIYNGIDLHRFHPSVNDHGKSVNKRELFKAKDSDIVITFAGQFIEVKGILPYMRAVQLLLNEHDNLFFAFIGQGPLYDEALSSIQQSFMSKVSFLGVRDDMENILRGSDIMVVPSIWEEAFGLVAAEASACGVPVVASDIGGLPEVVLDGQTGILVPPGDVSAIVHALKTLIENPDMRKSMGQAGRKHVEMNFDLQTQVSKTLALYKTLLNRH
jgi:L-malate glycosyltransferase